MKKAILTTVLTTYAAFGLNAAVIFDEAFDTNGTMLTSPYTDWTSLSGTGAQLLVTAADGLNMGPTDRDYGSTTFTGEAGTVYLGFDLTVDTLPASGNAYFAGFGDGTAYDGRIFMSTTDGTAFSLGVSVASNTFAATPLTYSLDTTYRVVASYNATTDVISLWIGTYGIGTPTVTTTGTDVSTTFNRVFLRQADAYDNGGSSFYIQNLVLTDTFATAVPEPASALMLTAGLTGLMVFRRRHGRVMA